jgi:hypothetical protein
MATENKKETESEQRYKIHIEEYGTIDTLKAHYPKFKLTKSYMDNTPYLVIGERDIIGYLEEVQ